MSGLDFPEYDFCIYTIPKNGGTTLWHAAYQLRFGKPYEGGIYSQSPNLIGDGSERTHRIVVVRDPIDRFLSGFCFLEPKLSDAGGVDLTLDSFLERFPFHYRATRVRHHLKPQYHSVNYTQITSFTEVIPFSDFHLVFRRMEELSGQKVDPLHLKRGPTSKPKLAQWHLDILHLLYDVDYATGYCEEKRLPP